MGKGVDAIEICEARYTKLQLVTDSIKQISNENPAAGYGLTGSDRSPRLNSRVVEFWPWALSFEKSWRYALRFEIYCKAKQRTKKADFAGDGDIE
jgi:hypothetical protein